MSGLSAALTINDLRQRARGRVPRMFFQYSDSGSWTESTFRANESEFDEIRFRQRVAVDMRDRSLATTLVGQPAAMPLAVGPAAICGLQVADGEIKAARAAEKFGIPFSLSTMSIGSIEDVAEATSKPFWFQLYMMRDKPFMERLIDRAKAARCSALIMTMDLQILGDRHADVRNGLSAPPKFNLNSISQIVTRPGWAFGMLGAKRRTFSNVVGHAQNVEDLGSLASWIAGQFDQSLTWKEVGWVKDRFGGPVIVKGILDTQDAQLAVSHGADAIVVSNHGGRQLDGAPSSIRVLPEIVDAVGHKTEILMDGGIRSGQHMLKALALGAKGVLLGRPVLYGLGAGGEAGVTRAFEIIRKEADVTMALLGERDVRNIGPHNIYSNDLVRQQGH
ncbi:MAG: alpha-hydroxy-acid oxidizing protein [Devosia sp.]|nr:alpha-hydroxy-acid oxidizing protein [Devosia sp.]MBN9317204.1 alpha-hydroxy-acid oxidizing protein [Devosia sp.]